MQWFNVEKVEQPSEEPPLSKPVRTLYDDVMEKDDKYYYRLFGYDSRIDIYDMSTYFLARQYAYDRRTRTSTLHAEYRLTLTDKAKKIVNELLSKPFQCEVARFDTTKNEPYYACSTYHPVYMPVPYTRHLYPGRWEATVYIEKGVIEIVVMSSGIPFNCGPLRPLWERAVECWVKKLAEKVTPEHTATTDLIDAIRRKLLEDKRLDDIIIPIYGL